MAHPAQRTRDEEIAALNAAVDEFAAEMKKKLAEKAAAGWAGWDNPTYAHNLAYRLCSEANLAEHSPRHAIKAANYAMMLWHQSKGQG